MKLKKIASLALAGIMAVSMLAGCKEGADKADDPSNEIVPTTNAATYANDALDVLKDSISFENAEWLNNKLKEIATNAGNFAADSGSGNALGIKQVYDKGAVVTKHITMIGKLNSAMIENGYKMVSYADFGTTRSDTDSVAWEYVYVTSGKLDQEAAVKAAVAQLENALSTTSLKKTVTIDGSVYNCEYTGEVSALRVTNDSLSGESAWAIAFVIEQNVTKSANSQV